MYSSRELADIHFIYGFCEGNAHAAQREYQQRYPNRQLPNVRTFIRSHQRLSEHGSFIITHEGAGREREGNFFSMIRICFFFLVY